MAKRKLSVTQPDAAYLPAAAGYASVTPLMTQDAVNAVATPSKRHDELAALRALPRALMGGTDAMRKAGRTYLPQHPAESDGSYALRLNATTLYNCFAETVISQAAKFFGDPVVLKETVPPALRLLCDDIDGQGRALTPFAVDLTREAFVDGISYILVDFPQVAVGATYADQKASGAQPYWVLLCADDIIGLRTENVNGQQRVAQVRIRECVNEHQGAFGEREVHRIRVLEPGLWQLYEQQTTEQGSKRWALIDEGATSLDYVPLVPFYTNRVGFMEGTPPLRTLAELNREHWHSSSEQRRALSFARFAMLVLSGVADTYVVTIAPDKVIKLPDPTSRAVYVESGGVGIEAGRKDLEDIERRMQSAGMELRVENAGRVTATAAAINSAETSAGLMAIAKGLEDAIEQALQMTADILRLPSGGEVEVKDNFGATEMPGTPADLALMRSSGNLSQPSYWSELKRRQVLSEDFDAEAEVVLLEGEQAKQLELQQQYFGQQQPQVDAQGNPIQPQGGA